MNSNEVLDFWIGSLNNLGLANEEIQGYWFQSNKEFDQKITDSFGILLEDIKSGLYKEWLSDITSALAYVITLDQFSRNIHRGSAEAFAQDSLAVSVTLNFLSSSSQLPTHYRLFLYMPLMHSEQLTHHEQLDAILKSEIANSSDPEVLSFWKKAYKAAEAHRLIIEKFSRYPHRNLTLGRESTTEEVRYLEQGANRYGQ